jgi:2-polyprenyl-3-methyl-5-hydroxy-6-metoxy-1,4-benzoquinol methylase
MSNQFVFKEESGNLLFIGDFEGLYKKESDPWGQSAATGSSMDSFYRKSRDSIVHIVHNLFDNNKKICILEIGCGLGHSTAYLSEGIQCATFTGIDISETAINEARKLYPNNLFIQGDIRETPKTNSLYDVVLLNQMLWYVLNDLDKVLRHARQHLNHQEASVIIISQAFPRVQRYGKKILNGYEGAVEYFKSQSEFNLIHTRYDDRVDLPHIDCHFILQSK